MRNVLRCSFYCIYCRNRWLAFPQRTVMSHRNSSGVHRYGSQPSQAMNRSPLFLTGSQHNYKSYLSDLVASSLLPHVSNINSISLILGVFVAASIYLLVVHKLRFRAIRKLEKQYGSASEDFKSIDYKDAQIILANLFLLEAPWVFLTAKDFAFLRVSIFTAIYTYHLWLEYLFLGSRHLAFRKYLMFQLRRRKWWIRQAFDTRTLWFLPQSGS